MPENSPAILAEGLRKSYGKTLALDGIDLKYPTGRENLEMASPGA